MSVCPPTYRYIAPRMIQRIILKFCGYVGCDDATNVSNFGYEPIKFSSFMLNIRMHTMQIKLGLWLRLECSLDCISGPVGYQQNIFILSLSAFLLKLKKCNYKKCNWVCGSPSILYKLVLGPVPIVHTNFQENLLMSYSWCPQLSR